MLGLHPGDESTLRDTVVTKRAPSTAPESAELRKLPSQHRTMMGVSGKSAEPRAPVSNSKTLTGAALVPGSAPPSQPAAPIAAGRTMPGIPQTASVSPTLRPAVPISESPRRREPPPLMGVGGPVAPPSRRVASPPIASFESGEELYVSGLSTRPRGRGMMVIGVVLAVLAIGALTGGFLLRARSNLPSIPAVVSATQGERVSLSVSLPSSSGATLRVGAQTVPLDADGRATFEVDSREVGEVRVPVTVERGSAREPRELRYFIAWRVRPRFDELGATPPRLLLEFHVPTGSTLKVRQHEIRVVNGIGIASIDASTPLSVTDAEGARRYSFPVEVTRRGVTTSSEYVLRVRRTPMRIEAPGPLFATESAIVTIRGVAPQATRVTLGRVSARIDGERFSADVPIENGPNSIEVVAFAPGGLPASQHIEVYRGVTPEQYLGASSGEHGAALLARPRDGSRIRVRGRVLRAIEAGPDGATFQLLVSDRACAESRCIAWIDPPHGTELPASQEVEVIGELRGARAYIAGDQQRRSAPVIRALFVR